MSRWHCTGFDFLACTVCIAATLLMLGLYWVYARQSHVGLRYVKASAFRDHLVESRNVFLVCGMIHALTSIVSWFMPIYYLAAAAMVFNSWQTWSLIRTKKATLAIQQQTAGLQTAEQIAEVERVVRQAQISGLDETLGKLESILRKDD